MSLSVESWRVTLACQEERRSLTAMLGRLKEPQLEGLVRALETRGGEPGPCCPVPANQRRPSDQSEAWLMARVFRGWGEDTGAMVRLPWCDQGDTDIYTCCNPFHWARVVTPGGSGCELGYGQGFLSLDRSQTSKTRSLTFPLKKIYL